MDMIERVAKAIEEVKGGMNYSYADFCRDAAIAAIKAMREPTPAMVEAGQQCEGFGGDGGQIYRIMIDTALAEGREG